VNLGAKDAPGIEQDDVFVTKLSPDGRLEWSTVLGGPNHDRAYGIAVDSSFVYVAGRAGRGFPVTAKAFQRSFQGGTEAAVYGPQDGFICKLNSSTGRTVFCSYFGTSDPSIIRDVDVDGHGDIYIASAYISGSFPSGVKEKFVNRPKGGARDAVLAKIQGDGTAVLWALYLGGSAWESNQNSVRVDGADTPYVLFTTESSDVDTPNDAYDRTYAGNQDLFVAKVAPATGQVIWGTYLGGSGNESTETHEFAVDRYGHAYVIAPTTSTNFATTPGAVQRTYGGGVNDIFVAKFSPDGSQLLASSLIGGRGADRPEGVDVDDNGAVYLTGTTTSPNFPITADALQPRLAGDRDAIAVKLSPDFSRLEYATYLGGSADVEYGRGAAVGPTGEFVVVGQTNSADFPTLRAVQGRHRGDDVFVVKFVPGGGATGGP
jgi:hypothetical protein